MTTLLGVLFRMRHGRLLKHREQNKPWTVNDNTSQRSAALTSMGAPRRTEEPSSSDGLNRRHHRQRAEISYGPFLRLLWFSACALRGLQTLVAVLDERKAKGIRDNQGREASPITDTRSKYERGRDILAGDFGHPGRCAESQLCRPGPGNRSIP